MVQYFSQGTDLLKPGFQMIATTALESGFHMIVAIA